jgi:hypothetical protein
MSLMSWLGADHTKPLPWATVACPSPACGERELAGSLHGRPTEFVCMNCGCIAKILQIKAITVQQPWAWCIAAGVKLVENRTWATNYRGPLAIHAGKTVDHESIAMVKNLLVELGVIPDLEAKVPHPHLKATGAVLAVADLTGICTDSARCRCGPWAAIGPKHWRLKDDVQALAEPLPARGAQGLWGLDLAVPA